MSNSQYTINHFRVDLEAFKRLLEFYPNGQYDKLDEQTVTFADKPSIRFKETWFLTEEDSKIWIAEQPDGEE